jgi:hypothetical protein
MSAINLKRVPRYLTNYDYLSKIRIGKSKFRSLSSAKAWIQFKMKETDLTLGQLAFIAGFNTPSQRKVFAQIVETVDTYSKIFHPIALKINKYILKEQINEGYMLETVEVTQNNSMDG